MAVVPLPFREPLALGAPAIISISGIVCSRPGRLNLNLYSGEEKGGTRSLHISIRFDKQAIVFNSALKGKWDGEETLKTLPFRRDSDFRLSVFVTEHNYEFTVDGKFVHAYKQKRPHDYSSVKIMTLSDTTEASYAPGFIITSLKVELYSAKQKILSHPVGTPVSDTHDHDFESSTTSWAESGGYPQCGSVCSPLPPT